MEKFKNLKSLKFLFIGLICICIFAIPTFVLWIKDPDPSSWYVGGIIAATIAGIANLKRFISDNRTY